MLAKPSSDYPTGKNIGKYFLRDSETWLASFLVPAVALRTERRSRTLQGMVSTCSLALLRNVDLEKRQVGLVIIIIIINVLISLNANVLVRRAEVPAAKLHASPGANRNISLLTQLGHMLRFIHLRDHVHHQHVPPEMLIDCSWMFSFSKRCSPSSSGPRMPSSALPQSRVGG